MTQLAEEMLGYLEKLPDPLQDEIASRIIADIRNEIKWQQTLEKPLQGFGELAAQAMKDFRNGKTTTELPEL